MPLSGLRVRKCNLSWIKESNLSVIRTESTLINRIAFFICITFLYINQVLWRAFGVTNKYRKASERVGRFKAKGGGTFWNHPATWRATQRGFAPFFFHPSSHARPLNYKRQSLVMLTIQYNMSLAALGKKCLTKQCKQQLQLCFVFFLSSVTRPFIVGDDVQYAALGHTYGTAWRL